MGLQLSGKARILVDGKPPKGLRERLWAWLRMREVNRHLAEWKRTAGMTPEQQKAVVIQDQLTVCRKRQRNNVLTSFLAATYIAIAAKMSWCQDKNWAFALVGAVFFAYRLRKDVRTVLALREQERQLIVEDVHNR